jgi:hypothetical protein
MDLLKRYKGRHLDLSDMPRVVRRAWDASVHRSLTFYGEGTVDGQMVDDKTRLCEATAEYLYAGHTPLEVRCVRGTRPELEKRLERILDGKRTDRERALAIMRFVRDLYRLRPQTGEGGADDLFHGGIEEEVIKKGSRMCNEQSRVFCVLSQVAGMPARYIGHMVGGHGVSEVYLEGGWAYFDNRGKYFLKADGGLASAWDLIRDPSLIEKQRPEVTADVLQGYNYDGTRRYFSRVEVTCVANYFVWERDRYGYDWIWNTPELRERVKEVRKEFPEELAAERVLEMVRGERPWPG